MPDWVILLAVPIGALVVIPFIVASFLRDVEAGTIRMVSWLNGGTAIYHGPGKSKEIPLLTTATTLSSKVINVDLDITDQTADLDDAGTPRPTKVRVRASAIVSVGDTDTGCRRGCGNARSCAVPDCRVLSHANAVPRSRAYA